jgi:tripartite-type tricarboxylate transporter receptor subunit TctC
MTDFNHLKRRRVLMCALGASSLMPLLGRAQSTAGWPNKPLRIIVGFPAGTSPDLLARALSEPMAKILGQPVVVENRVGAAGVLGAEALAKATDNHSFGVVGNAALTSAPILYPKLPYRLQDFAPITVIGSSPLLIVASSKIAFDSPADFFKQARAAGNTWSYGSLGVGSGVHLITELLKAKAGITPVHVPFNGAPAVINAMIGGDIHLAALPIGTALAQVQAGRIRGVAVTSASRSILAPDMPSLADAGVPALNIDIWNAVVAPASMPKPLRDQLSQAAAQVIRADDMRAKLFQQGWRAEGTTPEALAQRIRDDTAVYREIITSQHITVEG